MPGQGAQKRPKKLKVEKAEYGQQLRAVLGPWATASRDRGLGVGLLIEVRKDHGPAARVMRRGGGGHHEGLVERFDQRAAKSLSLGGGFSHHHSH